MMTQAFYTGISGLKSNQTAIDVVANNIANINTVGFKGYSSEFNSLLEQELHTPAQTSTTDNTVGLGSTLGASTMDTKAGSIALSDKVTDLAIAGNGWFGIQGESEPLYTRAGNFNFDKEGSLVTTNGHYVLGTMGNNIKDGVVSKVLDSVKLGGVATQTKLSFPSELKYLVVPTTKSQFFGNLGRDDVTRTMSATVIDPKNNKNQIKLSFTQSKPQVSPGTQWDIVATARSLDGATIYDTQKAKANFDASGSLISSTLKSIDNNGQIVQLDLGNKLSGGVTSATGVSISPSSKSDGKLGGELKSYSINAKAEVIATFTNGQQTSVGKIAVFHFRNQQGLERASGSTFKASSNSGSPMFFQDKNGENHNGARVLNHRLEGSNVGLSAALTDMIIFQRSYNANSKSVSTANEMMQKALQMSK